MCRRQLAGVRFLCAGNCSRDVDVSVSWGLHLVYFSICGQNNCSGVKKNPTSVDLFLLRTASGKERRDKARRGGLLSCVWIPANCLDEETLMSLMSHYLFFYLFLLSLYSSRGFLSFALVSCPLCPYPPFFLSVPYVCLNRLPLPFLSEISGI